MASITKNEHKSYGMGLHDEVLTGRTQQTFFNPEEGENFFYHDAFDVDFNKRTSIDVSNLECLELNKKIKELMKKGYGTIVLKNPGAKHSLGVGILQKLNLIVEGSLGYFGVGSIDGPVVRISGRVGWSCAENMMSGKVVIEKNAGSCFGAAIRGGDLICKGSVGARSGIDMKSPPRIAAPKHEPAFFSITTFPDIMFSAQDQPTRPEILTTGPSIDPTPKYPRLPSTIRFSF
jgi:hypothetical protein